jgi:hypothetical protein
MKKNTKPIKRVVKKATPVRKLATPALTKEELLKETEKISGLLCELKSEMNERFEHHQNIILAEYRHRIETLETKVRELQRRDKA